MSVPASVAIAAIVNITLARGTLADSAKVNVPGVAKFETKGPVDFVHSELTFQPGDATAWHYHPGPTLVTVKEGEITFTHGDCSARTPVTHPDAPASALPSGSTLRSPQHACRASTEERKPLMPFWATQVSTL